MYSCRTHVTRRGCALRTARTSWSIQEVLKFAEKPSYLTDSISCVNNVVSLALPRIRNVVVLVRQHHDLDSLDTVFSLINK
jgi:hypothetical protein